jgi:hypothetical protein
MKQWRLSAVVIVALAAFGVYTARAQTIPVPGGEIVLTDPLVRAIQVGPAPVGAVTVVNPATGMGIVAIPGIGVRQAKLVGVPVYWAGHRVVNAVDVATGVQFTAVLPQPPQLVAAKVVKSIGDSILVRRESTTARLTEAVPVGGVFAAMNGGLAPATRVKGALQPGSTVYIVPDPRSRAVVVVTKKR